MIHSSLNARLVLASSSPRRADLLRAAGFTFETIGVDVDEAVRAGERAAAYVRRLAAEKSGRAAAGLPTTSTVLGADTTVVIDGAILGKPRDAEESARMLRRLAGRVHEVLTGVSLRRGGFEVGGVDTSRVELALLSAEEIAWYVESGEGRDKAGAYAVQGLASRFVRGIEGSYANVVGLPVATVYQLLGRFPE